MNLFDGRFDIIDGYTVDTNLYKIQGSFIDNTGVYTSYDAQVGDIIYADGSFLGLGLLRYKITELHFDEYYDSVISATVKWDMIEGIEPTEPFGGMEGIIGALHNNGLTANITAAFINNANQIVISKAQSYQDMLLGLNSDGGDGGSTPDLSEINKRLDNLESTMTSVQLEWEDLVKLSFE